MAMPDDSRSRGPSAIPARGGPPAPEEIGCSDEEGRAYRDGVFLPLDEENLPLAPEDALHPVVGHGPRFRAVNAVPRVPRLRHLIGPSVIALGMGLGAGELLLWPNLIVANGWSIWWLFWVGVLTQYVVISEIERWTIATGESVFAGMARLDRFAFWPWFFLVATLGAFFWPGWASQSAEMTGAVIEVATGVRIRWEPIALFMLFVTWLGLAVSKVVYNALERFEIALVLLFFPMLAAALLVVGIVPRDVLGLAIGAVSIGQAPSALLTGAQFPTLLIAVAYAGSGGTLLLAQSLWIRDKGFGMAVHQGRIAGIRGTNEPVSETGFVFDPRDPTALARFRGWIRVGEHELLITFVLLILLSVVITTLLVVATLGMDPALAGSLSQMVTMQAAAIRTIGGRWLEVSFLLGGAFVLFSTQLGIVDTVTRIAGTIFYERYGRRTAFWTLKRTFLAILTVFTLASMAIIVASWTGGSSVDSLRPDFLVLIAGPFTIASMYAFALVVGYMNARRLPGLLATPLWKRVGMVWAGILWGWFTAEQVSRAILARLGAPEGVLETISMHPVRVACYGLWIASILWFAWRMLVTRPDAHPVDAT